MELYETNKYYIIVNGTIALFCDRLSGEISLQKSIELPYEWNPVCLGLIRGIIGKINFVIDGESKLLVINKVKPVGTLPIIGTVFRITKINIISINSQSISNLDIDLCPRHHFGLTTSPDLSKPIFKAFQDHMKSAAESVKPKRKDIRDKERFQRRMLEEFNKMFQDGTNSTDCFYISLDENESRDITSNIRMQNGQSYSVTIPLWRRADDRFFWNKAMLKEAIESAETLLMQEFGKGIFQTNKELSEVDVTLANTMIKDLERMLMPIIQGFVQVEPFSLNINCHSPLGINIPNLPPIDAKYEYKLNMALISRRSRYRAGTRFRRRGVDCDGNVANYVETEQILQVENGKSPHVVSFVQVRGSVPVFWSQFSLKYRPPIILEKSDEENQTAFQNHFSTEFETYEKVVVVNLVDTGWDKSERKISDAYLYHMIKFNSPRITCVLFDFHDYCSGLQFDNVSILIKGMTEIFRDMKYTWVDKNGMISEQTSIFRINCVDCLDRTNVVQCMLAGVVIETQLRKLGLLSPEESLPKNFHQIMLLMWANNGDAISRQYSGTAAMKGDYTRTGTRTMNGLVKDGVSSVSRYYLRLKEMSRQAALDLMTGNDQSAEIISLRNGRSDTEQKLLKQKEENIKDLASQCKKACLKTDEECLAESILIYCDENEKDLHDMNTVVLITSLNLYFISNLIPLPNTRIDFQQKKQPFAIALPLHWIRKIQFGFEPMLFRPNQPMIRIIYDPAKLKRRSRSKVSLDKFNVSSDDNQSDYYYLAFKQPSLRLFNNLLVEVKTQTDLVESLKAIAESFYLAANSTNSGVLFDETILKFDKLKSEDIPIECIFPVNINMIYENIVLASTLSTLSDDDDDMMTNISEEPSDVIEANAHAPGDDDASLKGKEVLKPIDIIKHGLSRVKDKVKITDWKGRFSSLSSRNTPAIKYQHDRSREHIEIIDISPVERRGVFELESQSSNDNERQKTVVLKKECENFSTVTYESLGSTSDDEIRRRRRDRFEDCNVRRATSDLFKYSQKFEKSPYSSPKNMNEDSENEHNNRGSVMSSSLRYSSLNNVNHYRINSITKDPEETEEFVLGSCGIIYSSMKRMSPDSPLFCPGNSQLVAATGSTYQRTAERISRQLSIDESSNEARILEALNKSPLFVRRLKYDDRLTGGVRESLSVPGDDFVDVSSLNIESMQDLISYIAMPGVDIRNVKVAERLSNKQIQLAFFVEDLRKKILDPGEPVLSRMIIF